MGDKLDFVQPGVVLRIKNPKSKAAKLVRQHIISIEDMGFCKVVNSRYWDGFEFSSEVGRYELNENLFGDWELDLGEGR